MLSRLLASTHHSTLLQLALLLVLAMLSSAPTAASAHATSSAHAVDAPRQRTQQPIVTGTSVLGLKYKDGVMLAADTLASYGSLARYKAVERICPVGQHTLIGASGEYSDFQAIMEMLDDQTQDDINRDDGFRRGAGEIHSYLRAVLYQRRNKFNPLWNYLLVAGVKPSGAVFLGSVDHIGTAYEDDILATGFGAHLALPIMRRRWRIDMEEGEARALLEGTICSSFHNHITCYCVLILLVVQGVAY
jgi:20S proteasome subunit beta 7